MLVWGGYTSDDQALTSEPGVWALSLEGDPVWTKLQARETEPPVATSPVASSTCGAIAWLVYGGSALFDDLLPNLDALEFGGDVPTAWIEGAVALADGVHLLWQTAESPGTQVTIEKRVDIVGREPRTPLDPQVGQWYTLAATGVESDGSVAWRDPLVGAGGAYSYRLVVGGTATAEASVVVPGTLRFALHGVTPSPTRGPVALSLQSTGRRRCAPRCSTRADGACSSAISGSCRAGRRWCRSSCRPAGGPASTSCASPRAGTRPRARSSS
jgi:hypothetical protein